MLIQFISKNFAIIIYLYFIYYIYLLFNFFFSEVHKNFSIFCYILDYKIFIIFFFFNFNTFIYAFLLKSLYEYMVLRPTWLP